MKPVRLAQPHEVKAETLQGFEGRLSTVLFPLFVAVAVVLGWALWL